MTIPPGTLMSNNKRIEACDQDDLADLIAFHDWVHHLLPVLVDIMGEIPSEDAFPEARELFRLWKRMQWAHKNRSDGHDVQ